MDKDFILISNRYGRGTLCERWLLLLLTGVGKGKGWGAGGFSPSVTVAYNATVVVIRNTLEFSRRNTFHFIISMVTFLYATIGKRVFMNI